jgi:hypothetical protein
MNYRKSSPLDFYLYKDNLVSKLGLSKEWELWFFGVTDHVTLAGKKFDFSNKVGIVFGLF